MQKFKHLKQGDAGGKGGYSMNNRNPNGVEGIKPSSPPCGDPQVLRPTV